MTMELKLPPPVLALLTALAMWALQWWLPMAQFRFPGQVWVAAAVALSALLFMVPAIRAFVRAGTTVDPRDPTQCSSLVTSGIFARSRNPMYCGLALLLCGWGLWLGSAANAALLALFLYAITRWQILPEEQALTAKFGDDYRAYCERVRRWL